MTETTKAATGTYIIDGRPRRSTSLTPHIAVTPAAGAVDFYRDAFHATVEEVTEVGGLIVHAQLDFGLGRLTLSDPLEAYGLSASRSTEGANYSLALYVPDVDSVVARAVARGATVREPLANFASGDRFCSIVDPFGVRWSIMTRIEDISDGESARRVRDWAAGQHEIT